MELFALQIFLNCAFALNTLVDLSITTVLMLYLCVGRSSAIKRYIFKHELLFFLVRSFIHILAVNLPQEYKKSNGTTDQYCIQRRCSKPVCFGTTFPMYKANNGNDFIEPRPLLYSLRYAKPLFYAQTYSLSDLASSMFLGMTPHTEAS